jgi:hypothetical protein
MEYEYKIVTVETSPSWYGGHIAEDEILKIIRDLAKKRWEFVSAAPITQGSLFRQYGTTAKILLFFKRSKISKTKE